MRKITATVDVSTGYQVDPALARVSSGSDLVSSFFSYSRVELTLKLLDLSLPYVNGAPASFSLSGATGVRFSIAQDFNEATAPLIRVETPLAEAVDGGNYYEVIDGGIRIVFTADTVELRAFLASQSEAQLFQQLSIAESDGDSAPRSILFQAPARIRGDIDPPEAEPPTVVDAEYLISSQVYALVNGAKSYAAGLVESIAATIAGFVSSVCGKTPDENGEISLDLGDLSDSENVLSGLRTDVDTKLTESEVDDRIDALAAPLGHSHTDKADLVDGKVPASQLPSYVSDIVEAANLAAFPATGETSKIYVAIDTGKTYRWGGTVYAEVSASLAIGETAGTAFDGLRGKNAETAIDNLENDVSQHETQITELETESADFENRITELENAEPGGSTGTESKLGAIVAINENGTGTVQPVTRNAEDTGWQSDGATITAHLFGADLAAGIFGIIFGENCFGALAPGANDNPLVNMWYPAPGTYCVCRISRWALGCKKTTVYYLADPEDQMPSERYEYSEPKYACADVEWRIVPYDPANGHNIPVAVDTNEFYVEIEIMGFVSAFTAAALQSYVDDKYAAYSDYYFATGRSGTGSPLLSSYYDDGSGKEPNIVDPVGADTGVLLQALFAPENSYHDDVFEVPATASGGVYANAVNAHLASLLPGGTLPVYYQDTRNE